ncbi:MAG: hypothetical protein H6621_01955 [Halobacteriovoraceae bacterium]|nr:hypothetical protein [Halobacteriovoraceae bacterium]MCB9093806.1 hypothetical protein [Halobacteriovoraceae bacterium]
MKRLMLFAVALGILFSCNPQEKKYSSLLRGTASSSEDDHNDGVLPRDPSGLPVSISLSESQATLELAEDKPYTVTIKADSSYSGGSIDLSVDRSSIDGAGIKAGKDVGFEFSPSKISLSAGETKTAVLKIKTTSMAPSFSGKNIKIVAMESGDDAGSSQNLNLEVLPRITIRLMNDAVPALYDKDEKLCFREHTAGLEVEFMNNSANSTGNKGLIPHATSGLEHGPTNVFLQPGESYVHTRKVMPDIGQRVNTWYNHHLGNDNNGKRMFFNLQPGEESDSDNCGTGN